MTTPWMDDACSLVDAFRAKAALSPRGARCLHRRPSSGRRSTPSVIPTSTGPVRRPSRPTCRCRSGACPSGSRNSSASRIGPTPRRPCSSRTASPTTTPRRSARCVRPPARCWPRRRRPASSAASTAPRRSCTARRATRGTSSARPAARRAARPPRWPAGSLPIATGSDGGGSIRIPAAFSGLFGLKATYGRIPKGPWAGMRR